MRDSILKPVSFDLMEECLGHEETFYYQSLSHLKTGFYAWGAVSGPKNDKTWGSMNMGDLVLTVYDNGYHFFSSVVAKIRNQALAGSVWGYTDGGDTWEYMYLLSEPQQINVDVLSTPVVNYLNKGYRGFSRISDEKVQSILSDFGTLEHFFTSIIGCEIPATHIDRELAELERHDFGAAFDPLNMVDGRQKVLREIVRRQGQPTFRRQLLDAYERRCAVTGCDVELVLEAAHIAPYFGAESNSVSNGLLLRADIHTLFDLGKLKIAPSGCVEIHDEIQGSIYAQYRNVYIRLPSNPLLHPSQAALQLKFSMGL
nr:HNH endonuclease signature motif containing protein [Luteibacter anthropi]